MNLILNGVLGSSKKNQLSVCNVPVALVVRTLKECCKLRQEERTFQHQKADFLQYQLRKYWFSHSEPKGEL